MTQHLEMSVCLSICDKIIFRDVWGKTKGINLLPTSLTTIGIAVGERNLRDDGDQRYPEMEKVTLSGSLQTKLRPQTITEDRH